MGGRNIAHIIKFKYGKEESIMKSVQSKKANLILNAGDFLSPVIESKLKRAAYSHKVTLIVIATDSGMVKEILKLEPYGIEENKILKAIGKNGDVYVYTHNDWHGYTDKLARKLYKKNNKLVVSVDGKIIDDKSESRCL